MKFVRVKTYEEMSTLAADLMAAQILVKPDSVIGLATGSTPVGMYKKLSEYNKAGRVDFSKVKSFNLDEYAGLDVSNEQSYRYFMNDKLFNHINIDMANTHVPNGCAPDLAAEGKHYDEMIKAAGGIDMQLLGIGHDGHIGFNEPDDHFTAETHGVVLDESTIDANSRFFEKREDVPTMAISMGMMSIMQAKKILFVANGKGKEDIVNKAFFGPITPEVPASILQLHPDVTVFFSEE